jgi:cobalt-zinc-cadmium efflux system protein
VGAWRSHSLALWADAGHTLTDLAAIGLSWYAFRQLRRPPTARMSFGFARIEVLVAFANALLLAAVAITLVAESVVQWRHPVVSNPSLMMLTAAIALGIYGGLVLGFHHQDNLNLYGTWLHLLSDAASSLAVLVGGALLAITHWMPINPLLTILIAAAMIVSTGRILREGLGILMEATPPGIEPTAITEVLQAVDGVERIHDLHIWRIGSGQTALACHVGVGPRWAGHDPQILLCELHDALESIGINHVTIQLEHGEETHHEPW